MLLNVALRYLIMSVMEVCVDVFRTCTDSAAGGVCYKGLIVSKNRDGNEIVLKIFGQSN
jgi:hypothetical protein